MSAQLKTENSELAPRAPRIINGELVNGEWLKRCPRCEESLPLSEFGVVRARPDGLNLYCKQCVREKMAAFRQTLPKVNHNSVRRRRRLARPERKVSVKVRRPLRDGSIDAGLELLFLATPRGGERSLEEIAFVCGCSASTIEKIQTKAMRKLAASPLVHRLRAAA